MINTTTSTVASDYDYFSYVYDGDYNTFEMIYVLT